MVLYVEGFHPEKIPSVVTSLGNDGTAASFCLSTATRPLFGNSASFMSSVSRSRYIGGAYAYTYKLSTSRVYRQLRGDGGIYLKAIGNKQVLLVAEAVGLRFRV